MDTEHSYPNSQATETWN